LLIVETKNAPIGPIIRVFWWLPLVCPSRVNLHSRSQLCSERPCIKTALSELPRLNVHEEFKTILEFSMDLSRKKETV